MAYTGTMKRKANQDPYPKRVDPSRGGIAGIQGILQQALSKHGLDQKIAEYSFVSHWADIVGADIAKRSRPECIRHGTLIIRVISSSWAQELSFHQEVILQRVQRFFENQQSSKMAVGTPDGVKAQAKKEMLSDIRFCVGPI